VLWVNSRRHKVSATDGVTQRVGMEPTDPPQSDHSEPDAIHRDAPGSTR
jgi:hypothetical protein